MQDDKREPMVVQLYKEQCIRCTYVNPKAEKTFKCHSSRGNDMCPAGVIVFTIGFNPEKAAERFTQAMTSCDTKKMRLLLDKVDSQPEQVVESFFRETINIASSLEVVVEDSDTTEPQQAPVAQENAAAVEAESEGTEGWED